MFLFCAEAPSASNGDGGGGGGDDEARQDSVSAPAQARLEQSPHNV